MRQLKLAQAERLQQGYNIVPLTRCLRGRLLQLATLMGIAALKALAMATHVDAAEDAEEYALRRKDQDQDQAVKLACRRNLWVLSLGAISPYAIC